MVRQNYPVTKTEMEEEKKKKIEIEYIGNFMKKYKEKIFVK